MVPSRPEGSTSCLHGGWNPKQRRRCLSMVLVCAVVALVLQGLAPSHCFTRSALRRHSTFQGCPHRGIRASTKVFVRPFDTSSRAAQLHASVVARACGDAQTWPSVGVLVSTYERPELLVEALRQVGAQDYAGHVEVVVVDDSSESVEGKFGFAIRNGRLVIDDVHASAAPLPEVQYIYLPERMSIGAKRNLAARSTDADILCVWDDDDVFTKDRLRKQVEHLQGLRGDKVDCSAIEIAAMYSVPKKALHVRQAHLPQLVFENTLCFTRAWWESNKYSFGEPWEVSGQGEGTLQPWWDEVHALAGADEPFLYIYLPSSVSGGTALCVDPHPDPDERMFALVRALQENRFPQHLPGPHVQGALAGTCETLRGMLENPNFMDVDASGHAPSAASFRERYQPVRETWLQKKSAPNSAR